MSDQERNILENNNVIIVKKKSKHGHGHHGGAWKVAYADFVTAMMALFIVLWVLSQGDEVRKQIASYFRSPIGISIGKGTSVLDSPGAPSSSKPSMVSEFYERQKETERLKSMGNELIENLKKNDKFKSIIDQIEIQIVKEGLKIEIMDSEQDFFFEISNSTLKPKARNLLLEISQQLSEIPNSIVIEGHTDSRNYPGNGTGYTNYELSADRANSARRALISGGLKKNQIDEIRGLADNQLRNVEDPFDAVNRRISIIVKFISEEK